MRDTFFLKKYGFVAVVLFFGMQLHAQPITGIWKGKMGNSKVELKIIRKGDSLIGTSYYYNSNSSFRRYSIKGYFDDTNNDVIWWDDVLLENNGGTSQQPMLAVADFNCPGEGIMKLDGKSSRKQDEQKDKKELHLVKGSSTPIFPDEWDFLIENYAYGVAHPEIVDSIEQIAFQPTPDNTVAVNTQTTEPLPSTVNRQPPTTSVNRQPPTLSQPSTTSVNRQPSTVNQIPAPLFIPPALQTNEERFTTRAKILQQVIPVKGDSIELKFYDNAEIDGDSIAVFLNGHLLQEHVLLSENAYIMKIAVADLQSDNELVMVAENLGTIPPNTSLMVAVVEEKRYEAHLQSTEGSSAMVRLVKP